MYIPILTYFQKYIGTIFMEFVYFTLPYTGFDIDHNYRSLMRT